MLAPALSAVTSQDLHSLSKTVLVALQHLVTLAGGWQSRPSTRRSAYDSAASRTVRRQLSALCRLQSHLQRAPSPCPGPWPHLWQLQLHQLQSLGVTLPQHSVPALCAALHATRQQLQARLHELNREMRHTRHSRWKSLLPQLWQQRPSVIHHWLHSPSAPWGTTPILDENGVQCTSVDSVDAAVRGYWVDTVLRHHATVDEEARWSAFQSSRFGSHIPTLQWPSVPWSGSRVRSILQRMREAASPGSIGIPISVWRSLPDSWMDTVAHLLSLIETSHTWPVEWLDAYVAMIPKSSGGLRPRDQRPITVLDILYRIWSKGVVIEWAPVLQREFLGPASMGFRAQSGTLHVVQLLSDLIILQGRRRAQLCLASFDIEKCFDMLPWWALFRVLRRAGVRNDVVRTFISFYTHLQRRFRYGQVDGRRWCAANGLAQGCPASPDLLNILFEAFHRWAYAAGYGVSVEDIRIASVSFADDLALVATCRRDMEELVAAYLEWCSLLGVNVTKVQLWCNRPGTQVLQVAGRTLTSSPTFRMVGVVLGANEHAATQLHFSPRLSSALTTTQRLRSLPLPASICSLLWRTAVLPKALYGCEVRDVRPRQLTALTAAGRAAVSSKHPLQLNLWRSPEMLSSPALLGDTALLDPLLEARLRQLQWLQLLANLPSLVGTIHRAVASLDGSWSEPTASLRSALQCVGWSAQRNDLCHRARHWPSVAAEDSYCSPVLLTPADQFPPPNTVYTDGSVSVSGGAAAFDADTESSLLAAVPCPRSSTHCELVALCLALSFSPPPSRIITDSLASLQLIQCWGTWPTSRHLRCADRVEVRQFLSTAMSLAQAPVLEKVKAHNDTAVADGHPQSVGNDRADELARLAAEDPLQPVWDSAAGPFGDPVLLLDATDDVVVDVRSSLLRDWWSARRSRLAARRPWFSSLLPEEIPLHLPLSTAIFRRPTVSAGAFIHPTAPATIKWIARLRAGCIATGLRRHTHLPSQVPSPACICCGSAIEDDAHALAGCTTTGAADWAANLTAAWATASHSSGLTVPLPTPEWLASHHIPLLAALIPMSLSQELPLPPGVAARFLSHLHRTLAQQTAERFRRRQELIATSQPMVPASPAAPPLLRPCPLPPERQFTVSELRQLEIQRREPPAAPTPTAPPAPLSAVPVSGEPRRLWLRERLVCLINEDTVVCPVTSGSVAPCLLELFERVTGEPFSETPGALLTNRVRAIAKVLGNLVREVTFTPPLLQGRQRAYVCWNRCPRERVDWVAWRRRVEATEEFRAPPPRTRTVRASIDAELASWIRHHRYLRPVELDQGESGMSLLLLWEVDHDRPFPTQGDGSDRAAVLTGFTRRLQSRVAADEELSRWLTSRYMQQPLAPGLAVTHHHRWSLRVCRPPASEPQGWYDEFTSRWRAYLATQMYPQQSTHSQPFPPPAAATASSSPACSGDQEHPSAAPRRRTQPPKPRAARPAHPASITDAAPAETSGTTAAQPGTAVGHTRPRSQSPGSPPRPRKRQSDMRTWLRPKSQAAPPSPALSQDIMPPQLVAPTQEPEHGRAASGPPT